MPRRIRFKRRFKRRFRRKAKIVSTRHLMNFFGTRPILKKIMVDSTVYLRQPAGYAGTYSLTDIGQTNGFSVFANLVADPVYDSWKRQFSMMQIKGVTLSYASGQSSPAIRDTTGVLTVNLDFAPEIGFNCTSAGSAVTSEFMFEMNSTMKVKPIDTSRTRTTKTWAFPPYFSCFGTTNGNADQNQTTVWGSKVWFNTTDFDGFTGNLLSKQPVIYLGQNEEARVSINNTGAVRYFRLGTLQIVYWCVFAGETMNT